MIAYATTWIQLKTDCRGVTALEYGLIAAAVAGVLVTAMALFGPALTGVFTRIDANLG
jgi:Flp pilus assembly pilin Flp